MEDGEISIEGLDKAAVLAALYNGSRPVGMGFLNPNARNGMTIEQAREFFPKDSDGDQGETRSGSHRELYFDYVQGRVLKCDLSGDVLRTRLYDRDNGQGSAARIIEQLRASKSTAAA